MTLDTTIRQSITALEQRLADHEDHTPSRHHAICGDRVTPVIRTETAITRLWLDHADLADAFDGQAA